MNKRKNNNSPLKIAVLGHKTIPSRQGGIEIVVEELTVRMAKLGYKITVYNRSGRRKDSVIKPSGCIISKKRCRTWITFKKRVMY